MLRLFASNLRARSLNGLCSAALRFVGTLALLCALFGVAHAYTLVMRGGQRREIPDAFRVTQTTLTYAAAPGLNVTLPLARIDIAATERANGEAPGSLLRRIAVSQRIELSAPAAAAPQRSTPTLTNRELEGARRAREASEREYERRREELGLPSAAETRRRDEAARVRLSEIARETYEQAAEAESFWRTRAGALRTDMAALDAEIAYLRARVAELSAPYAINDFAYIAVFDRSGHNSYMPFGGHRPGVMRPHAGARRPVGMRPDPQLFGQVQIGGSAQGVPIARAPRAPERPLSYQRGHNRRAFSPGTNFAFAVPQNHLAAFSSERSMLAARLYEAEAERAALQARWRLLEEEARRAGALPGWLRP